MKKLSLLLVLALVLGLCGCRQEAPSSPSVGAVEETAETAPETTEAVRATVPEDGDPNDVTCKGSYTGTADSAPEAVMGEETLTNQALQVWYWAEVAQYREEGHLRHRILTGRWIPRCAPSMIPLPPGSSISCGKP